MNAFLRIGANIIGSSLFRGVAFSFPFSFTFLAVAALVVLREDEEEDDDGDDEEPPPLLEEEHSVDDDGERPRFFPFPLPLSSFAALLSERSSLSILN